MDAPQEEDGHQQREQQQQAQQEEHAQQQLHEQHQAHEQQQQRSERKRKKKWGEERVDALALLQQQMTSHMRCISHSPLRTPAAPATSCTWDAEEYGACRAAACVREPASLAASARAMADELTEWSMLQSKLCSQSPQLLLCRQLILVITSFFQMLPVLKGICYMH